MEEKKKLKAASVLSFISLHFLHSLCRRIYHQGRKLNALYVVHAIFLYSGVLYIKKLLRCFLSERDKEREKREKWYFLKNYNRISAAFL